MKMIRVLHNTDRKTTISLEYTDQDFARLPGLPEFLATLEAAWERLMDDKGNRGGLEPFSGLACAQDGCHRVLTPGDIALEETHCESHQTDAWGVTLADCYCYQSAADNADIDICGPHRLAWEARGEGPLPSSFMTS